MYIDKDKMVCVKCKSILTNSEPGSPKGEFWHDKDSLCISAKEYYFFGDKEITPFKREKFRRARTRGAKLASKYR